MSHFVKPASFIYPEESVCWLAKLIPTSNIILCENQIKYVRSTLLASHFCNTVKPLYSGLPLGHIKLYKGGLQVCSFTVLLVSHANFGCI